MQKTNKQALYRDRKYSASQLIALVGRRERNQRLANVPVTGAGGANMHYASRCNVYFSLLGDLIQIVSWLATGPGIHPAEFVATVPWTNHSSFAATGSLVIMGVNFCTCVDARAHTMMRWAIG